MFPSDQVSLLWLGNSVSTAKALDLPLTSCATPANHRSLAWLTDPLDRNTINFPIHLLRPEHASRHSEAQKVL